MPGHGSLSKTAPWKDPPSLHRLSPTFRLRPPHPALQNPQTCEAGLRHSKAEKRPQRPGVLTDPVHYYRVTKKSQVHDTKDWSDLHFHK